jgi:hypothetical protein
MSDFAMTPMVNRNEDHRGPACWFGDDSLLVTSDQQKLPKPVRNWVARYPAHANLL